MKKQYTKKQIVEAIKYWENRLKMMNESKTSYKYALDFVDLYVDDTWVDFDGKGHYTIGKLDSDELRKLVPSECKNICAIEGDCSVGCWHRFNFETDAEMKAHGWHIAYMTFYFNMNEMEDAWYEMNKLTYRDYSKIKDILIESVPSVKQLISNIERKFSLFKMIINASIPSSVEIKGVELLADLTISLYIKAPAVRDAIEEIGQRLDAKDGHNAARQDRAEYNYDNYGIDDPDYDPYYDD